MPVLYHGSEEPPADAEVPLLSPSRQPAPRRISRLAPFVLASLILVLLVPGCGGSARHKPHPGATPPAVRVAPPIRSKDDPEALEQSVHRGLDCTACHLGRTATGKPTAGEKPGSPGAARCDHCHQEEAEAYNESVHGVAIANGKEGAARCRHCHGAHDIVEVTNSESPVNKRRLPLTCARCHQNPELAKKLGIKEPYAAGWYLESIHGRGLLENGLIVAPSCVDCHGSSHHIQLASSPESTVNRRNVPETCGACHVGTVESYRHSIHGQRLAAGDPRAPVCTDCHTSHQIEQHGEHFKLESDKRCGACHEDRLKGYWETYHGKAHVLGEAEVAACYDCHGHHDVQPATEPTSKLSPQNILGTCSQCHPGVTENFTGFLAHADHTDKQSYPRLYWAYMGMTALLLGVFSFFGLHTLLWFGRTLIVYLRDPKRHREMKQRARDHRQGKLYTRFRPIDRFCHFLVIISFLLLVATGMPLKFPRADWAQTLFAVLGGPHVAADLHRLAAIITFLYFTIHICSLLGILWRNRPQYRDEQGKLKLSKLLVLVFSPDSPMPNLQDVKDLWAHLKWFVGRGPRPAFDRWTYWEKFDYMAVFWGVAVIGLSGLVMWIPQTATIILPGWIINIAHIVHSDEALLAAGFIFTFHFFNSHLRPEKFPIDTVMFSGRITEEEMLHERRRLYDRLKAQKSLQQEEAGDE